VQESSNYVQQKRKKGEGSKQLRKKEKQRLGKVGPVACRLWKVDCF
jgi:hypothetical protein